MNRMAVFAMLIVSLAAAEHVFTVDIDRGGSVSATLSIQGDESVAVPLAADSRDFRIVGGDYSISNGSAMVRPGKSGITTFSFTSSLFTSKSGDTWKVVLTPPEGSSTRIYLPEYASLGDSSPAPASVSASGYSARVDYRPVERISLSYVLGSAPQSSDQPAPLGQYVLGAAALLSLAMIVASYIYFRKKPASGARSEEKGAKPSLDMTSGKKAMMETMNENDRVIVGLLLGAEGKMRRNELERRSGVSKSSLAMALNRLEKRKIIGLDRTSTTHFVRLSDYFLSL
jgi:uncharacterized membrane protein